MNLEEDVNVVINLFYDDSTNWNDYILVDVIETLIRSHGVNSIIHNLQSRNRTKIIGQLIDILSNLRGIGA